MRNSSSIAIPNKVLAFLPLALELLAPVVGYFVLHALGLSDVWALTERA